MGEGKVDELMNADATLILTLTPSPIFGYITQIYIPTLLTNLLPQLYYSFIYLIFFLN